jgi:hypothetical protein
MNNNKELFTQGEWIKFGLIIIDSEGKLIADCRRLKDDETANANLIKASPKMYRALIRAYSHLCNGEFNDDKFVQSIKIEVEQAIREADGSNE